MVHREYAILLAVVNRREIGGHLERHETTQKHKGGEYEDGDEGEQ